MKKIIFLILLLSFSYVVAAQGGYESILAQIESNSTTLKALREQMEAHKISNRTGIYLENPEVEFAYQWGRPASIGNRTNISVTQSFDFPTVYGHKNKISKLENINAELEYKSERLDLLLSAKQICIELIYCNALAKEYSSRLAKAEFIANAYQRKLDKGETNAIEFNKAHLNFISVRNDLVSIETEREALLSELKRLNGGIDIAFSESSYPNNDLPKFFEDWYSKAEAKSPMLQYVSGQIKISEQQTKLGKAMTLPKFSAGYLTELVPEEQFHGAVVGISIPLWENKNIVKQAKAQKKADETLLTDSKVQFYNRLQNLYYKSVSLKKSATDYRDALSKYSNEALLKKALDAGEISLLTYLLEIEYYYEALDKVLETEKNFELSLAELCAVEL